MNPVEVSGLADRVKKFLSINEKVKLIDLKIHLRCTGTDLLIASGWLVKENYATVKRNGSNIWICKNKPSNEPG